MGDRLVVCHALRTTDRVEKPPKWTSAGWFISEIAEGLAGI
jgi:hypothetical protein